VIAERLTPSQIECLIVTAVELWENPEAELTGRHLEALDRARHAILTTEAAEDTDRRSPSPAVTALVTPKPTGHVWILRRWDRHTDEVTPWADEDSAMSVLADHVRTSWGNVVGDDGIPDRPPLDDREAVRLYYGPSGERGDEGYRLYVEEIGKRGRTRLVALPHQFPDTAWCEQVNRSAVSRAIADPHSGTLRGVEVGGVLVLTQLDPCMRAVAVWILTDGADDRIVQPDGTVPLYVDVDGKALNTTDSGERRA